MDPKYSREFLTAAPSELLHRISRVRLNVQQGRLLSSLEMAAQLTSQEGSSAISDLIIRRIGELRGRVARASELLSYEPETDEDMIWVVRLTYPRDIVKPGGRHDNDKADITNISIFPTRAEISSDAPEFLPWTMLVADCGKSHCPFAMS